ncbi:MAG: helix-turn-helix transcriptional regulator [Flavobacteriales bacterium]|nr:helix-turn-helix transcriptional regulator [Flavobacteriales bacterium]
MEPCRNIIIRNMVCDRCKAAVRRVLDAQGLAVKRIDLGEVELLHEARTEAIEALRGALMMEGFELVDDRDAVTIARIKAAIVKLVHHDGELKGRVKLGEHIATALNKEYSSLTTLFTQGEGITIEQFFLLQRLEHVKELIKYGELTLSEIADRAGFSSAAHLSTQFKKLTGMTPSAFKGMGSGRTPLDQVGIEETLNVRNA